MNILYSIHLYPPHHNCGAEYMAHNLAKELQKKGHTIRVLLHQANHYKIKHTYTFDGVDVFPPNPNVVENLFRWADCVCTHLDYTHWTIGMSAMYKKPLFHFIHNTHVYPEIAQAERIQHIVYNSQWAKEKLAYKWPNFTLTPPVDYRQYDLNIDPKGNKYITLINLNKNKGGEIFQEIARAMPHKSFLGVLGSYDEQITQTLPNILYVPNSLNISKYYAMTRVLLMPSEYESWGRTATEAMCSGIPVISTMAEGLVENCGSAGIYIKKRDDIKSWVEAITKLDDEKAYAKASRKAKERSREHDPIKAIDEFEAWMREKVNRYNN